MPRKYPLVENEVHHVMNKSIAGYTIFNHVKDYFRMTQMMAYYSVADKLPRFSWFLKNKETVCAGFEKNFNALWASHPRHVRLIAYCLMPTHIHLVLQQLSDKGIQIYMSNLSNSYSRYFNLCHQRKGPLWVGRFKNVRVEDNDHLAHLTRYVHLNPVSAGLIAQARDWEFSSYNEYVRSEDQAPLLTRLCHFKDLIPMSHKEYENFVNEHAETQKDLAIAKKLAFHTS